LVRRALLRTLYGCGSFAGFGRWQTENVPVDAVWAAIVVIIVPPVFR
jgi:hypothetical protein